MHYFAWVDQREIKRHSLYYTLDFLCDLEPFSEIRSHIIKPIRCCKYMGNVVKYFDKSVIECLIKESLGMQKDTAIRIIKM